MGRKITIIGYKGSGKTSYLVGMYHIMSGFGLKGYSLTATRDQDLQLENMWEKIEDKKQYPSATLETEELAEPYDFCLSRDFEPVCNFTWIDYPGGLLSAEEGNPNREQLSEYIKSSDTLFLVFPGNLFKTEGESIVEYEKQVRAALGKRDIKRVIKEIGFLAGKKITIPPICIIFTKADLIEPAYLNIIQTNLLATLNAGLGQGREIFITAVTLGENLEKNGPDPQYLEEPIAFAVMNIALSQMEALQGLKNEQKQITDKYRDSWSITRWWNSDEIEAAKKEYQKLSDTGKEWTKKAMSLLDLFQEDTHIFVNGVSKDFKDYMRKKFDQFE